MTMQNPQTCLSAELLRQLSHDELSPAELKDVEDHVSDCERCRQLLEVPQSDSQWQDEIVPILRTPLVAGTFHVPTASGHGTWNVPATLDHDDHGSEGESLESILRLLGPTDDPHMLGRIGAYEVVGVIGRGGMRVVFKAYEGALNRFVAIKMLLPHLAASGAARKRFAREGKAAAAVIDDNVMPIYSVAEWQGVPYLVTQYSRGATLEKRIRDQGPLELKETLRIGMQTARGLAAAHAQGLVHRDVKPSNILLDGTVERALLTDFGLARAVDDASITRTGIIAGTPQYMSPEQARGGNVDARSDLFGLGCVLYAMCTGRPPFRADNSYAILRMITDDEPRSIREINPDIPEWLCLLISRLMAKSPDARFANALEVAALLEQCLAHVQQPTSVPLPASLVPHAAGRRSIFNSTRKGVLAMLGVFGVTLLGMVLLQATEPPDIGGQWTSHEWGTVVLEAKGAGEYEGTFTGSGKDKPVVSNEAPGGSPRTEPGVTFPMLGYGWIRAKDSVIENQISLRAGEVKYLGDGLAIADVNGDGQAEVFRQDGNGPAPVAMDFQDKASDAFKGIDTGPAVGSAPATSSVVRPRDSGTLNLKWSRVERRFNGTWGKGADRSGTMSLRLVDKEIRGGFTTDEDVQLETGTPLVGDLLWKRSVVTVPDGGSVLLGGPKRTREAAKSATGLADVPPTARQSQKPPQFETPEALVDHINDCSRRQDRAGYVACLSDDLVDFQAIQLMEFIRESLASMHIGSTVDKKEAAEVQRRASELNSIFQESLQDDPLLQADPPVDLAVSPKESLPQIVTRIKDRRRFSVRVYNWLEVTYAQKYGNEVFRVIQGNNNEARAAEVTSKGKAALILRRVKGTWIIADLWTSDGGSVLAAKSAELDKGAAKVPGIEEPLDRQNARAVVEAFLAAAIAGRIDEAVSLTEQTELAVEDSLGYRNAMAAFFRQFNVQRLAMKSVYVNEPAEPVTAMAISEAVKLAEQRPDGQRDGIFVLTLTMSEEGWFVSDYFLDESAESADHTLKKYLEANPKSISVPPQREAQGHAARANPLVGHWKVVKLADIPVDQLAGATVVIDEHRVKMQCRRKRDRIPTAGDSRHE